MNDLELTPALEQVAASVAETHRKRQQVEDELKAAQAVVESLKAQSTSLEASLLDLRRQLGATLQAKAREDATLAELVGKRHAVLEQLAAITRDVEAFLADKNRAMAEIAAQIEASQGQLGTVEADIGSAKTALASLGSDVGALRDNVAQIRRTADAAERELAEIQSKTGELDAAADAIAARVCGIAEAAEQADRSKQKVQAQADELRALSTTLGAKRAEAEQVTASLNELLHDRERQTAALAKQLEVISELPAPPAAGNGTQTGAGAATSQTQQSPQVGQLASAPQFRETIGTLELLASLGFISAAESADIAELLQTADVDKLVRSMWSRAMGGSAPGMYRLIIGQALRESGDAKGAITFLNQAIAGRSGDPFITYLVAVTMLHMKRYVDVFKVAQLLSRTRNGKLLGRNVDGLHLQSSGRLDEAEKKFVAALVMVGYPKSHYQETMYNLARLAESKGDARNAMLWYEKLQAGNASYRDITVHIESLKVSAQTA